MPLEAPTTSHPQLGAEAHDALHAVLDRIHDAVIAYDRAWRYVFLNRSAEQYIGVARETLLGKVLWEVFPGVLGTDLEARLRRAAAADGPSEFEVLGPIKHRHIALRVYPSEDGIVCYYRDVTEQREAQAALRASEERYRSIFANSLNGMFLTRASGEILAANPAACQMLGQTEEEICAGGREVVVDLTDPRLATFLAMRAETGLARGELRLRRKDGSTFLALASSAVFDGPNESGLTSLAFVDLTERERGERALEFLTEAGTALSASLDREKILQTLTRFVVPARAALCAVDLVAEGRPERVAAASASPEVEPLRAALLEGDGAARVRRVIDNGEPEIVPVLEEVRDPSLTALRPRSLIVVPMRVGARCVGALSLVTLGEGPPYDFFELSVARRLADLTALAIDNTRHYQDALDARQMRDEMLGIVSHDLRSPLNTIALNAAVIGRRNKDEATTVERITRAVKYATRIIEDLLEIARVDAGRLMLRKRPERVSALCEKALALHAPQAEERGVRIESTAAEDLPDVLVDRHRIVRLLGNLLTNAIKFTPAGGTVSLGARAEGGAVVLSVADTGVGIPPEDLPRLFDRFWQGTQARRADAGLGLSIVKGIAEAHGGAVTVRSEIGRGSTFEVTLPLQRE